MAWALLLLTLLTQGSGEASRVGTMGTSGLIFISSSDSRGPSTELSSECIFALFRFLGPGSTHSACLSVGDSGTVGHHLLCWKQQ